MFSCKSNKTSLTEEQQKILRYKKEEELLDYYGLKYGIDYHTFDLDVTHNQKTYQIHAFQGGADKENIILLLHGYGGSNVNFCRTFKNLIKYFQVYAIDLPGMGFSSKKDIPIQNAEVVMKFFMDTLSKFIIQINKGAQIVLIGHSFGGFLSAHLLVKYPELFRQVILLSPAGTTYYDETQFQQKQVINADSFLGRTFFNFARSKWNEMVTPQTLYDKWYGSFFIKRYLQKRLNFQGREYQLWQAYVDEMLTQPEGSEKALFLLLHFPRVMAKGRDSIEYIVTSNRYKIKEIPIYFYFGAEDWMDSKGAIDLAHQLENIQFCIIQKAGHQMIFENPDYLVKQITHDIFAHEHEHEHEHDKIKLY